MNTFNNEDQVLAFAGIQQAATLIQQVATTGVCDEAMFEHTIKSLYHIDSPDVKTIFGGVQGLRLGLNSLHHLFTESNKTQLDKQISRYLISMIQAERLLLKAPEASKTLAQRMPYLKNQANYFTPTHEQVIKNLGHLYEQTVGQLRFKIGILGRKDLITRPEIMSKIRALLLAGIRSAVLWQQVGGSRFHLLFTHWRYKKTVIRLLAELN